jgi:signal transduction histidine kinase
VEIPPAVPQVQIMSEIRTDIYLVVKEALHNTLKHSGADLVTVDFDIRPGLLLIKVTDNGKGYAHPVQPGNGLLNMKKRVERLGGKMKTSSHNGITILFTIPLK